MVHGYTKLFTASTGIENSTEIGVWCQIYNYLKNIEAFENVIKMHFKTSLPLVYIALVSLCEADTPVSATDILDFKNLILPQGASTLPLKDLGGTTFENFQVTKLTNTAIGGTLLSGIPGLDFLGDPTSQQTPTVAIIDPAHAGHGGHGGHIIVPPGKRLASVDFFCCSAAAGESILEGKPCKQKACKVTLDGTNRNGEKIREISKTSSPLSAVAGGPAGIVQPATVVAESTGAAMDIASFAIGFTDIVTSARRRRGYGGDVVARQIPVSIDTVLVVVGLVFSPLEDF
ncbi:hypothetical protein TWF696_001243 [Orbilia brochopaga]|uniref:Uncharacterized protein n=1 Tax=Orbilia brochopaga TaxID=3140254 RepID=A0AAV9U8E5_9PEZI